jgi:tRNA nucleotidyltransferase/poly(A) polymerase
MADYIYLLENRLSEDQKKAISTVREIARAKSLTVFLVGGAVRDLTTGSSVRDLDVAIQGNALKLKKELQKAGAVIAGELEPWQTLYVTFPGGVRMEVGSTLSVHYPKPGKPVIKTATILDDLRRRDFTANAMAISLNEGSYGLLMDPLNGVADIENRELRLASNYGFIEEPVRMIRAARFVARMGWQLEEKTQARYETGKAEGYISAMQDHYRGYEAEEIVHEEDPLRVVRNLEQEGWLKYLAPAWSAAKVNEAELEKLHEAQAQLQMQGILADPSAAHFLLLTAKMAPKDVAELKKSFPRQGFVAEIEALEGEAKHFAAELGSKQAAAPSAAWKLLKTARPESVLWVAYSTKSATLQAKFHSLYTEWPQARQRIPYPLMQEMRIVPELEGFDQLVDKLYFELMDGKLGTVEEMKAFLEPYSPPAPPPPVHLRRARTTKKDAKAAKALKMAEADESPSEKVFKLSEEASEANATATEKIAEIKDKTATVKVAAKKAVEKVATKTVEKKAATPAKKAAPVKVAAPVKAVVKAVAAKTSAKKPLASKPVAAKVESKKVSPAKPTAKKAAPAKQAVKAAAKKIPAKQPPTKAVKKAVAKPVVQATKSRTAAKSHIAAKPVTKTSAKAVVKPSPKHAVKLAAKSSGKKPAASGKKPAKSAPKKKR